ncbi:L-lactate dehydrogenase complex protein LldF [Corynebacterium coyleae]|uniref:Iron-sulfur cluster-binding protein n=2 Tax=Corynebacterium coyleae TaxID=53374 RepID=A0ABX8KUA3_9CORY|nr:MULTISPECIES: LutB/LldF family L-lactate oxidation iron-sulfur protein [Corynebacterium]MDK6493404.1 LutB/LldF family L-lactate oxidation iron-sulfur protein [Corynebacterium coyleae]MDK8663229.1 LutB/LldF family L-lactate oxidation iron-sulfur protein [Corynebacterium coyleae]MDK8706425.1 LutB/LldF family L-lactate oxidation iron-sulfur protein [Corynebacterium coyleae]MDK8733184.1 LutB/LldF family L-lactate oxidation iron-sulfur protein [Corynebacterium coyleae]MDK8822658.1 LutB/LldF fami
MKVALGQPTMPPFANGPAHLRGKEKFQKAAHHELNDVTKRRNYQYATTTIRVKRQNVVDELDDWQQLREAGSTIKRDVAARMPELLEQFEENVTKRGGHVHWARDSKEANEIIQGLIKETGEDKVVKIKSMATQEIALNDELEKAGIFAQETDLAELIVQLGEDFPSHILVPAIHRNRAEIRDIFAAKMPNTDETLTQEPAELAEAARQYLRQQFMEAKVAISGANFGCADTGTVSIVESEGNGRMCLTLPETLITVMGIEKLLPSFDDLGVFLQLLPRSSTGERMNPYTSLWSGVTEGDGPQNFHIVLLDNGRTAAMSNEIGREALKCIRCSACLNVCPVYERAGGHSYGSTYPGPIGAILTPQLTGIDSSDDPNGSLPYASSLCGRCNEVCPVKIPITDILLELRYQKAKNEPNRMEQAAFASLAQVWGRSNVWNRLVRMVALGRVLGGFNGKIETMPPPISGWTGYRDVAVPPKKSFRQWWETDEAKRLLSEAREQGIPNGQKVNTKPIEEEK